MTDDATPYSSLAIALIDDALVPIDLRTIASEEQAAVMQLLTEEPAAKERERLGMEADPTDLATFIETMSDPELDGQFLGALIRPASHRLADLVAARLSMRRIARSMQTSGAEVQEFGPEHDTKELDRFRLVFLDYNLDPTKDGGDIALDVATRLQKSSPTGGAATRQVVLMSSDPSVRKIRTEFRKQAGVAGTSFSFVAKPDLDRTWKVKAHVQALVRAEPLSAALSSYLTGVKMAVREAADALDETIDDLDLGDFAYIQRNALKEDGHPLGDYISGLLSTHVTKLVFEGDLRGPQLGVDQLDWGVGALSQTEPSTKIASLYHDSLFSARQGPIVSHPLAEPGSEYDGIPMIQLGDVFFDQAHENAVVVLSAACDLAFAPRPGRAPDATRSVLLMRGTPVLVHDTETEKSDWQTDGIVHDESVYRIDWHFRSYTTVPLGALKDYLERQGFKTADRERLRPLHALKLQQAFGSHLTRVGPPVMAPNARRMEAAIIIFTDGHFRETALADGDVVASFHDGATTVRLTTSVVGQLQDAAGELVAELNSALTSIEAEETTSPKAAMQREKRLVGARASIESLLHQIEDDEIWVKLADDHALPKFGALNGLGGPVRIQNGGPLVTPNKSSIILFVGELGAKAKLRAAERSEDAIVSPTVKAKLTAGDTQSLAQSEEIVSNPWRSGKGR
jgi:hypothetical protein